jgi:hypothetical protein
MTLRRKTAWGVVGLNLLLFIALTSWPAFTALHHHWVFPAAGSLVVVQWIATWVVPRRIPLDIPMARSAILWALGFIAVMGVVRHRTILACFDACAFKLAGALALAGIIFLVQERTNPVPFWNPPRCEWAGLVTALWAVYLVPFGRGIAPWALEVVFSAGALLLWLGRSRPAVLAAALGIPAGLLIRHMESEEGRILLTLAVAALSLWAVPVLTARWKHPPPHIPRPRWRRVMSSALRIFAGVFGVILAVIIAMGPTRVSLNPARRRAYLRHVPVSPPAPPDTLSPLARTLREHVTALAEDIGPRPVHDRKAQAKARAYIMGEFRRSGYSPAMKEYPNQYLPSLPTGEGFANVEAVHPGQVGEGTVVIGAHYDTVDDTPGADDNASGVAVLLETARLLARTKVPREIRFVAFGTEEPPSFGTINMGSRHYAQMLKKENVPVHLMVSLEMLGYYNPRAKSQVYPPFLQLFHPDRGDFVSLVSNAHSRKTLWRWEKTWRRVSPFPLETTVMPSLFSHWALSDQLNFWDAGYTALLLTDTAFFRNPHYHRPTDTPATLDYERMAQVTRALAGVLQAEN